MRRSWIAILAAVSPPSDTVLQRSRRAAVSAMLLAAALALLFPSYPHAAPWIGAEHPLSAPAYVEQDGAQTGAALARGDGVSLIAWLDDPSFSPNRLRAARIDDQGTLLDPTGFDVAAPYALPADGTVPAVSWGKSSFLVVWADRRGPSSFWTNLYARRVSASGEVLGQSDFAIAFGPGTRFSPSVVWTGSSWFVAWSYHPDRSNDVILQAIRISDEGQILDTPFSICEEQYHEQYDPVVVSSGDEVLVAWTDYSGRNRIKAAIVGPDLAISCFPVATEGETNHHPVAGWNGTTYLLAWTELSRIAATRIGTDGTILDPSGTTISSSTNVYTRSIASDGQDFFVGWENSGFQGTIRVSMVDGATGEVQNGEGTVIRTYANTQPTVRISFDPPGFDAVWNEGGGIMAAKLSPNGTLAGDPVPVTRAWNDQAAAAIAYQPNGFNVVWADGRASFFAQRDLYGGLMTSEGAPAPGTGIPVRVGASGNAVKEPAIAVTGSRGLAVWREERTVFSTIYDDYLAMLLSADGSPMFTSPIVLQSDSGSLSSPAVASNGSTFLAAWRKWDGLVAGRIDQSGVLLDPRGIYLPVKIGYNAYPAIAWSGKVYFVAWLEYGVYPHIDVYGGRVSPAGRLLDRQPILLGSDAYTGIAPAIASDGSGFLVAWVHGISTGNAEVRAVRVGANGRPEPESVSVSSAVGLKRSPSLTWDGSSYVLAWEEGATGATEIRLRRISASGAVDPRSAGGVVLPADTAASSPRITRGSNGRVAIVYQRSFEQGTSQVPRAQLRLFRGCGSADEACPFAPELPDDGVAVASDEIPLFWWEPGTMTLFRVEFCASADFSGRILSSGKFVGGTSFRPSERAWMTIARQFGTGHPVYWRVAGKPSPSGAALPSSVRSFTILP